MLFGREKPDLCPTTTQFHPPEDPPGLYNFSQCATTIASNTSDVLQRCCASGSGSSDARIGYLQDRGYQDCWAYCNFTSASLGDEETSDAWDELYDCWERGVAEKFKNQSVDTGMGVQCMGPKVDLPPSAAVVNQRAPNLGLTGALLLVSGCVAFIFG